MAPGPNALLARLVLIVTHGKLLPLISLVPSPSMGTGDVLLGVQTNTPGVCRQIQAQLCSSPLPAPSQSLAAHLTSAPWHFPDSSPHFPSPGASLTPSCPVAAPAPPKERMQLCKSKAGAKQKKSSLVLFSFLGHFELIKECDLNYKYPPSRMIYGLFVLDWYVLNL